MYHTLSNISPFENPNPSPTLRGSSTAGRGEQYSLRPEPLSEVDEWIKALSDKWDERLLRLKAFVESEQADE